MLKYALLVLFVGALGGLVLASFVLRGRLAPWLVSVLHALLGASGLSLVILGIINAEGGKLAWLALCVLLLAAGFGFYLATIHYGKQIAFKRVVLTHAGLAVTGVCLLLLAVFVS
ncbi:MAG: hypothetical protein KUL77_02495 [Thermomonas sp.]|jgi:hypothetical protein|uniref:hypothetical protein n=1 Tax=Thermomonas sp. TaxID=1971895 RepID=UPI001EC6469F|nr:hypothetical protein [Thermomonas sp.]MBV2208417.1 hypothetical protein [Thermomonas sp.]